MNQPENFDPANLSGVHLAPNIQGAPDVYEIENRAADPTNLIEKFIEEISPWAGKTVLDLGAGTGFHLKNFHEAARHLIAVEPHAPSRFKIMERVARQKLEKVSVMAGSAEQILLPGHAVDLVHARFAYFWGPGCEPGLKELARVVRPGGWAFIIDNYLAAGTFAEWLEKHPYWPDHHQADLEAFWTGQGFKLKIIESEWRFESRGDLEKVVRLEFPGELGNEILAGHAGTRVEYHYALYYRQY
ncbi:MAG: class I SAM-dependent methyltransferase [Chloroflexi bacterium]|nr:class I SAM-dependent methyltransferase [Chloroflexota bacterium]OJV99857.1 MAG: hypothetical protein BGO39_29205 [Chloroflexi bacterium 54-19]